jgi:hypothetical protein
MKPRKLPSGPLRFRYRDIVRNVEEYLQAPTTPPNMRKRFEQVCELDHGSFSHRLTEYRNERFVVEHFGAMAHEARAPEPWPWVSWDEAERYQAFKKLASSHKR